ncbi:MAG: alpha/beta hydrolase [Planctomycetes bacterium]|nr:alpha/beta hydrolase [Planctomycetota bacterium]
MFRIRFTRLFFLIILVPGCAWRSGLRSEKDIPRLAELSAIAAGAPSRLERFATDASADRPWRIAAEWKQSESPLAASRPVFVMIHGMLSDRRVWRFLAGDLLRDSDVLLLDLPGCGDSDKPDPGDVGLPSYRPDAIARRLLAAIQAAAAARPDRDMVLVGHSFGGMLILRILGNPRFREEFTDLYRHIKRAVLVSTPDFAIERVHPLFARIAAVSGFEITIASFLGILQKSVVESALEGSNDSGAVTVEDVERMIDVLDRAETRRPAQAMLAGVVPFRENGSADWPPIDAVSCDIVNINIPCLVLWGSHDETFNVAFGYKLAATLRFGSLRVLPKLKHSPMTEDPRACADWIRKFNETAPDMWKRFPDPADAAADR